jgi:flagellar biosynthesis chaperone FliJ
VHDLLISRTGFHFLVSLEEELDKVNSEIDSIKAKTLEKSRDQLLEEKLKLSDLLLLREKMAAERDVKSAQGDPCPLLSFTLVWKWY